MRFFILFLAPIFVLASQDGQPHDFIPRTINFIIFAAILYFLLGKVIKKAYYDRINLISSKLRNIEKKLKESSYHKENIQKKIEDTKISGLNMIEQAKFDADMLKKQIAQDCDELITSIKKNYEDKKAYEEKKVSLQATNDILDELFSETSLELKKNDILNIIKKKVE